MKKVAVWVIFITVFVACSSELENPPSNIITSLQVTLSGFCDKVDTRTQESGYQTSFSGDEQIGIFALNTSGNVIVNNNIPYKYNASTGVWQPVNINNQVYVYGSGITYYAYYPYSSSMDGKKSITEITSAFTIPEDQSDYDKYTSADLMTAIGALSSSTLSFPFTHAMSLVEIKVEETTNSSAPYDSNPVFYGMKPWKMPDGVYRYLIRPGVDTEVAFDYGPADNRYAYQKSLAAADVTAGKYTRVTAPFRNWCVELNTGSYAATLGPVSKVVINGNEYTATAVSGNNSKYILNGLRKTPATLTSFDVYITDNLAKEGNKEQLLVSATTANITVDANALTMALPLSAGGMEGAGTEADPYLVTTSPQLRGVAQSASAYYKQMENINLSIYDNWQSNDYSGTYDGNHKGISSLTCNGKGLFKALSGTIKNAHITSGSITSNGTAGAFCQDVTSTGTIENCSNAATIKGTVKGSGFFGGICGQLHGKMLHCKNTGTILGKGEIFGGIVGWVDRGTLQYSYNEGEVQPDEPYHPDKSSGVGGVAGAIYFGTPTISYCYNAGAVKHYGNEGMGTGGLVARGEIVGWTDRGAGVSNNWYVTGTDNRPSGDNSTDASNQGFDDANNKWPVYSTVPTNDWGNAHWKTYTQGEFPKLLWE